MMDRCQTHKSKFRFIGRLGNTFNYYTIPQAFQTNVLNQAVEFDLEKDSQLEEEADDEVEQE